MKIQPRKKWVKWYWCLVAGNGEVLAVSETYFSKGNAMRAARTTAEKLGIPVDLSKTE